MKNKIKYYIQSYNIDGLDAWIPSGNIVDNINNKIVVTGFSFPENRYKSKSEADNHMERFFSDKGYHRG